MPNAPIRNQFKACIWVGRAVLEERPAPGQKRDILAVKAQKSSRRPVPWKKKEKLQTVSLSTLFTIPSLLLLR